MASLVNLFPVDMIFLHAEFFISIPFFKKEKEISLLLVLVSECYLYHSYLFLLFNG